MHRRSKHEPGSQTTGNSENAEQEQESYPLRFSNEKLPLGAANGKKKSGDVWVTTLTISTMVILSFINQ